MYCTNSEDSRFHLSPGRSNVCTDGRYTAAPWCQCPCSWDRPTRGLRDSINPAPTACHSRINVVCMLCLHVSMAPSSVTVIDCMKNINRFSKQISQCKLTDWKKYKHYFLVNALQVNRCILYYREEKSIITFKEKCRNKIYCLISSFRC